MFNNNTLTLRKISVYLVIVSCLYACDNDEALNFIPHQISQQEIATINITYPIAEGNKNVAKQINETIDTFLANEISLTEKPMTTLSLNESITGFEKEYTSFKTDFYENEKPWEASIESEVTYESMKVVCIVINTYLDTGGAHGNSHVSFLNFDKTTGKLLKTNDIFSDLKGFEKLAETYFNSETKSLSKSDHVEDAFFGMEFQLPEQIGFGDKGIILLYNVYEIASYDQGVTEFLIPYEKAKPYLKVH